MTEETLEEKLAAVRENLATEWYLRTVAEQEAKRQRERIAELERQLAAEREARQKAEAACAAYHAMLDELADAAGLRDNCCEFCGMGLGGGKEHDEECISLRLLALLAEPNPGGDLLGLARDLYRAVEAADHIIRQAEGWEPELMAYAGEAFGWDQKRVDALLVAALRRLGMEDR